MKKNIIILECWVPYQLIQLVKAKSPSYVATPCKVTDYRFCRQHFMVNIVAQLLVPMHLDTYMVYLNHFYSVQSGFTLDCKKLISRLFCGCQCCCEGPFREGPIGG